MLKLAKKVIRHILVPVAHKCSGIETVNIIKTLRKAGLRVTVASVEKDLALSLTQSIKIQADKYISKCAGMSFHGLVLTGGIIGNITLRSNKILRSIYTDVRNIGLVVALSCASAMVLSHWGNLDSPATCSRNENCRTIVENMAEYVDEDVVVSNSGTQITSRNEEDCINCALKIVEALKGLDRAGLDRV